MGLKEYRDAILVTREEHHQEIEGEYLSLETAKKLARAKKIENNWNELKKWASDYRYEKIGTNEDNGRYCVAISVTDLLKKMEELEGNNECI